MTQFLERIEYCLQPDRHVRICADREAIEGILGLRGHITQRQTQAEFRKTTMEVRQHGPTTHRADQHSQSRESHRLP